MKKHNPKMWRLCGQYITASDDKCPDLKRHPYLESDVPVLNVLPQTHTPTPWNVGRKTPTLIVHQDGLEIVADCGLSEELPRLVNQANAAFIVRAVNCHEGLITAMQSAVAQISKTWEPCDGDTGEECGGLECHHGAHRAVVMLENALAKAEGSL